MGELTNRHPLTFSECGQLSQARPQFHVERASDEQTPVAQVESRHSEHRVYGSKFYAFQGRHVIDCQRMLEIRITGIILASGSSTTIARYRQLKNSWGKKPRVLLRQGSWSSVGPTPALWSDDSTLCSAKNPREVTWRSGSGACDKALLEGLLSVYLSISLVLGR